MPNCSTKPDRGKRFRLVEQNFGEDLFVKQIQTPWPEPDEIDQEDGERHQHDRDRCEKPLQYTHGLRTIARVALVNINLSLRHECDELIAIFVTILKRSKQA